MKRFKADLHMHTVLSPCGSLEMSPVVIVEKALERGIDIIGITDHNSTRQCAEVYKVGQQKGVTVFCGVEVTTKEEVHCLTFFENFEKLDAFQVYLDKHLPEIPNDPERFGHQVWVDVNEEILGQEERLLISAIEQSIDEVEDKVRELDGLFIPAHIFRPSFSVYSQLGFMPFDISPDAIGISSRYNVEEQLNKHPELKQFTVLRSSDAHFPEQIGTHYTIVEMEEPSFEEFRKALHNVEGRRVIELR
ncbi:PHP domain-containing protein [Carboxylicivirga sediminis]|uniref:PHP domain-containing protein n=1 Tax=Carboxylicivirga sediminis TaxID=2006564 RepID=A0A941F2G3_9BACT|nr:PHP domain-containing protein [Carboxylicivirga sediminis]MBR8534140.1 PHP domain-containing protein [Carboxylicivirga sediminis]